MSYIFIYGNVIDIIIYGKLFENCLPKVKGNNFASQVNYFRKYQLRIYESITVLADETPRMTSKNSKYLTSLKDDHILWILLYSDALFDSPGESMCKFLVL